MLVNARVMTTLTTDQPDIDALYREHRQSLLSIATRRLGVPQDEAEELLHDVFVSLMRRWRPVRDVPRWLVGAICQACRYRIRRLVRLEQFDADTHDVEEAPSYSAAPMAQELVRDLSPIDRSILRWRYAEGLTAAEIGVELGCSSKAAD